MFRIAGLEKLTLIDYPEKIAAIIFTYGCNLRCEYCHNPELVIHDLKEEDTFDNEKVLRFLKSRVGKLDAVVITGGEPLIYDGLEDFIRKVKELGYLVKLDTNGLLPNKLEDLVKKNILDYIAMDIKYPEAEYISCTGTNTLANVKRSVKVIMNSGLNYEFRTTYVKGIHDTNSSISIGKMIKGAKQYYIQNFRPGKTINPELSAQNSFTTAELEILRKNVLPFVQKVEVRD